MAPNKADRPALRHVAIIMDGNKRWAEKHGLPALKGHGKGAETVHEIVKAAKEFGIEYLTLYAFSTENWKRSKYEVGGLMGLLRSFIVSNLDEIDREGVRLRAIGRIEMIPWQTRKILLDAIKKTENNKSGNLTLALSYGGRTEIVDAVKKISGDVSEGKIKTREIDEALFSRYLYAPDIPDPDLLIRTSGEFRISNFLLWQISYSEIWITDTLWPDFSKKDLKEAIDAFYSRKRRYGGR
ncbi:MAG: di-trans,poly-cis-decaprenylcistransferase [Lentisphaerae bacterium GWF2_50_93]|nr:MAG: di-trans,poly-cis-decaprenylcistransferase [Lentisphaerae bacterium GWF2_50_93]